MIYADNAATTAQKPPQVIDAVVHAMQSMGNCARGTHGKALAAARSVYETRCKVASFFGCSRPDHVVFTSNSTEALNIALNGLFEAGDHIISTDLEHNSVLRPLYRLQEEKGIKPDFLPADADGCIDYGDLDRCLRPETRAVVCTHASNLTGNMLDISRIGAFTRAHNLLLVVDASQTAGCVPIDMEADGIDVLCFTGHKGLMGPQGTGGLCIREGIEIRPFKTGGTGVQSYLTAQPEDYPVRLEAGTLNGHGLAGLSAALDFISEVGLDAIAEKEAALVRRFLAGIRDIEGIKLYGDFRTDQRTAIVALNIRDYDSGAVADALATDYDIAVRPGAHCAPRMHRALGTVNQGTVRFSFSYFNTEEEIDQIILALKELAE